MPRRHTLARKINVKSYTLAEKRQLRHDKRKKGPSALWRKKAREGLQPKLGDA